MKAWQRWQDAQAALQKKRETEAKLLWANKPDKLQLAKEEIVEVQHQSKSTALKIFLTFFKMTGLLYYWTLNSLSRLVTVGGQGDAV